MLNAGQCYPLPPFRSKAHADTRLRTKFSLFAVATFPTATLHLMKKPLLNLAKGSYRFLRLDWDASEEMSEELNGQLAMNEEVVSVSIDENEILVLVRQQQPGER